MESFSVIDSINDEFVEFEFESQIIDIDKNFFVENNLKRYLIFGTNSQYSDSIKNNSLYGIQSNHGFFMFLYYLKNQLHQ